jgi:hypothetical protein
MPRGAQHLALSMRGFGARANFAVIGARSCQDNPLSFAWCRKTDGSGTTFLRTQGRPISQRAAQRHEQRFNHCTDAAAAADPEALEGANLSRVRMTRCKDTNGSLRPVFPSGRRYARC